MDLKLKLKRPKKQPVTKKQKAALYKRARSFIDFLPWVEFLEKEKCVLFEDGVSVGAVFEVTPVGTAGRTQEYLAGVRSSVEEALQDSFDEHDNSPWVIQTYTFDEEQIEDIARGMLNYADEQARESQYTKEYVLNVLSPHYSGIGRRDGIFVDDVITQAPFAGRQRRNFLMIYRRHHQKHKKKLKKGEEDTSFEVALGELNDTVDKFTQALRASGCTLRRLSGHEFHDWLLSFFNPSQTGFEGTYKEFLDTVRWSAKKSLPYGDEFAESLFFGRPRSDQENGCWWFGDRAVRCISIDGIRRRPAVGQVTGETKRGEAINTLIDMLPPGTIFVSTLVVIPQDTLEANILALEKNAIGDSVDSVRVREDCEEAKRVLGTGRHKIYRSQYAALVLADDADSLNSLSNLARAVLLGAGFRAIAPKDDFTALDALVRNMPMVYDSQLDEKEAWRGAQLQLVQHHANLSCFFGRSRGTGHPGVAMFNRGGEPLLFDPLNSDDRKKNAHMLILGPTGAGKSATLVSVLAHVMAMHRPRMFIIEAGNSFGLLADWFETKGLSVNRVSLKPGTDVSLPPFRDACRLVAHRPALAGVPGADDKGADEEEGESRDVLGEMEIVAKLMITGGEEREAARLTRSDRFLIQESIIKAAKTAAAEDRMCLTEDVAAAMHSAAEDETLDNTTRRRLREMSHATGLFCEGFTGEVFNRAGQSWPEADVTVIDLATFAREGYEAHLAISVVSCLNMINNIAERDQFEWREIVVTIDEAHIITTNPLLAPFLVKIVKMWRKLGAWLWTATQNMEDYPREAKKMLNMVEWWLCLVMPKEEIEDIARFRDINDAQRDLMLSASKAPGKYTEGVVLSESFETLFRNVPPSLMLALAQTEKHEKTARMKMMREHGVTEAVAAEIISDKIDRKRGIKKRAKGGGKCA